MGYDDRREILERLEALERMIGSRHDDRGGCDDDRRGRHDWHRHGDDHEDRDSHGRDGRRGGRDSDEKRIIDTIVRLVSERVGRMLESRDQGSRRNDDGRDEKRVVDLVVSLVAEKVQEIVSAELDRRLGRSEGPSNPSQLPSESEQP